jgi:hypothetical protein
MKTSESVNIFERDVGGAEKFIDLIEWDFTVKSRQVGKVVRHIRHGIVLLR